jgi:hypothetical protein
MAGKKKYVNSETLQKARELYEAYGPNQTAASVGMSPNKMRDLAREHGWKSPRERAAAKRVKLIQKELDEVILREYPRKGRQLAFELGYSEEKIRKDAVRLGVNTEWGEKLKKHKS